VRQHAELSCTLLVRQHGSALEHAMPTEESQYEIPAPIVYERRGQWSRVALPTGSAWIGRAADDAFLPYPPLLKERMAYLRSGWDGMLRSAPGFAVATRVLPAEWRNQIADGHRENSLSERRESKG
jgi:hypothetical protein